MEPTKEARPEEVAAQGTSNYQLLVPHEYDALRAELQESKRFIFERPVLTVIAIFAAAQLGDSRYLIFLPVIGILLLYFNLLFTYSRLRDRFRTYFRVILGKGKRGRNISRCLNLVKT